MKRGLSSFLGSDERGGEDFFVSFPARSTQIVGPGSQFVMALSSSRRRSGSFLSLSDVFEKARVRK